MISARQEGNSDSNFRIFPADEDSDFPPRPSIQLTKYEGWNFNSGNYLFTTDTK